MKSQIFREPRESKNNSDDFWDYKKETPNGCWVWIGGKNKNGYGRWFLNGKYILAHRLSYQLKRGEIPNGLFVCHDCPGKDNPLCINPDHLWLGTAKDNSLDASRKGTLQAARYRGDGWREVYKDAKWRRGDDHWIRKHPERIPKGEAHYKKINPALGVRGERVNTAKLTPELVEAIRKEYIPWKVSTTFLAKKYGISKAQSHKIVAGQCWKHIPMPDRDVKEITLTT